MRPSRAFIAVNLICFAVLLWFFGGDVVTWVRAKTSPVAALTELPALWLSVPVALAAVGILAAVLVALRRGKDDTYKGYRLLPILLVVAFFVKLFVLGEATPPISSANLSAITLHGLSAELSQLSTEFSVPTDPNAVALVVDRLGPPPYLVHGERPARFGLQVRTGCEGPIGEAAGVEAGTVLYCVAKDRSLGWLTLVGLPAEETFGHPAVYSRNGDVQVTHVFRPGDLEVVSEVPPEEAPEVADVADAAVAWPDSGQPADGGR